jgi:hypothetical protein
MSGTRWRANMSDADKWNWHTEIYAIRRIFLNERGDHSPVDPEGRWYSPGLVDAEERRRRKSAPMDEEAYARGAGWSSALERRDIILRNKERLAAGLAWQSAHPRTKPTRRNSPSADLGVKVREYTPAEMAEGRRQLGLEDEP